MSAPKMLQNCSQWPLDKKKKVREMYFLKYPVKKISQETTVPEATIWRWITEQNLREIRARNVVDIEAEARRVIETSLQGLDKATRAAVRILDHMETRLDAPTPQKCLKSGLNDGSHNPPPQSPLEPKDLESLANALASVSGVLLRVFNK